MSTLNTAFTFYSYKARDTYRRYSLVVVVVFVVVVVVSGGLWIGHQSHPDRGHGGIYDRTGHYFLRTNLQDPVQQQQHRLAAL